MTHAVRRNWVCAHNNLFSVIHLIRRMASYLKLGMSRFQCMPYAHECIHGQEKICAEFNPAGLACKKIPKIFRIASVRKPELILFLLTLFFQQPQAIAAGSYYTAAGYSGADSGYGFATMSDAAQWACATTIPGSPTPHFTCDGSIMYWNGWGPGEILASPANSMGGPTGYWFAYFWDGIGPYPDYAIQYDPNTPPAAKNFGSSCSVYKLNPIHIGIGDKFQKEQDYVGPNDLSFIRYYHSSSAAPKGSLGPHWRHSYDRNINLSAFGVLNVAYVTRPNGMEYSYQQNNGAWVSESDISDVLVSLTNNGIITGWQLTVAKNNQTETYNSAGQLISISDLNGLTQTLTYSDSTTPTVIAPVPGLLINATDSFGRQLNFTYDVSKRLQSMTEPMGKVYQYGYDAIGNLSSVTYPDSSVRKYLYEYNAYPLLFALTGIIDENNNRYATWTYDTSGRAISSEHGATGSGIDKGTLLYTTDGSGSPVTVMTDALGTARTYNFQTVLGVVKNSGIIGPPCDGCNAMQTFDLNGNVASRTDFNGNASCYAYDLTRNLETTRIEGLPPGTSCPANLTTFVPAQGSVARVISTQWHPTFRLPTQIAEPGRTTNFTYDATTGNLLTRTVIDTASSKSLTWNYAYTTASDNTLPNLLKTVNGPRTDVLDITNYGYYPNGDLKTITDALGHVTAITNYDGAGRPLSITDPNGVVTKLAYTPRGWLQTRQVGGQTSTYGYDNAGNLTRVLLADGSHLDYTYDAAHRLTDISDAKLDHVHYTLDSMGNRTKEDDYDAKGQLSKTLNRTFDSLNRLYQDIRSYNSTTYTTNYSYDANGNLTKVVDAKSNTTTLAYDALDRLINSTNAASGVTKYAYDGLDQLSQVTDPRTLSTNYTVDALGNTSKLASPDSGISNNAFDSAGNPSTIKDARGITATLSYDALNRPLTISYPTSGENITYTWDTGCVYGIGRICQETDSDGSTSFAYDSYGNLVKKTRTESGASFITQYAYDAANRLVATMTPTGETLSVTRDEAGNIEQVSDSNALGTSKIVASVEYNGVGNTTSQVFGNSVTQTGGYDSAGQMQSLLSVKALAPSDVDSSTIRFFISGSSAKQALLEPALMSLMEPGSMSVFYDVVTSGANHRAYLGIGGSSAPASLAGKKVLVVDRSQGGSVYGVIPVALASPITALSVDASCMATGNTDAAGQWLWNCFNTANVVPDAGLSAGDPALFVAYNIPNLPGTYTAALPWLNYAQQQNLSSTPVAGEAMGVALTNNFLTAGTGSTDALPTLSKPQVTALLDGISGDWSWVDASLAAGPVTVCKPAQGLGVQAKSNAYFMGFPCSMSSLPPASPQGDGTGYTVIENASENALAQCMGYVQNGTPPGQTINIATGVVSTAAVDATHITLPAGGRGIGILSTRRLPQNAVSEPYHFIAIAGVAPTIENATLGDYDFLVEDVMIKRNYTTSGILPLLGTKLDFYNYLAGSLSNPTLYGVTKTPSVPGMAAIANLGMLNYDPTTTDYNGTNILLNPVLRIDNNGNTCMPYMQVQ